MFGELALSERAIASQGVMLFGAETLEASFTSSANASPVFTGVLDLDGTSIKASIGVGVFSGVMTGDINFTQTSTPSATLSGVQEYISSFDSTTAAQDARAAACGVEVLVVRWCGRPLRHRTSTKCKRSGRLRPGIWSGRVPI